MNHWAAGVKMRPMTATEVLAVFNARREDWWSFDPQNAPPMLTTDMTLRDLPFEWRVYFDDPEFDFADMVFCWFGCTIPGEEWAELSRQLDKHTVGDVCSLIGQHAEIEQVEPLRMAANVSPEAGVFLAMLHMMERIGIDTRGIKPSDSLAPWLRISPYRLHEELMRLFPGLLPETEVIMHPLTRAGGAMCLREVLSLIAAGVFAWLTDALDVLLASMFGLLFAVASVSIGSRLCPTHTQFTEELTFRDLCRHVAAA